MTRNLLVAGVVSVLMALFVLIYSAIVPPTQRPTMTNASLASGASMLGSAGGMTAASPAGLMVFREQIRLLLLGRCVPCHNSVKRSGELDLTIRAAALVGGETGPAIVPGKPEESLVIQLVTATEMPKNGNPLTEDQIAALKAWIALGAPYEFEPIDRVNPVSAGMSPAGAAGGMDGTASTMAAGAARPGMMGGGMMGGSMGSAQGGMEGMGMMCPCMKMMGGMSGMGGKAGNGTALGQSPANAAAHTPLVNPQSPEQARQKAEQYVQSLGNPNLQVGKVNETVASYEIEVLTKDGSRVNYVIIDKQNGKLKTLYGGR